MDFKQFPLLATAFLASLVAAGNDSVEPWHVVSGEVSRIESTSGAEFFLIHAGTPPAEVLRFLSEAALSDEPLSVRLWILPVADAALNPLSSLNILGARLGFIAEEDVGRIYALDGEVAVPTPFIFETLPSGEATGWMEVEVTFYSFGGASDTNSEWRLSVNGVPFDRAFAGDAGATEAEAVQVFGNETADVFLGELIVLPESPDPADEDGDTEVSETADADGQDSGEFDTDSDDVFATGPAPVEEEEGSNLSGDGGFTLLSGGSPQTVYVDGGQGNDANDGLTAGTAKATIGAGVDEVADGGTVIVAAGTYVVGTISTAGRNVIVRPNGLVTVQ